MPAARNFRGRATTPINDPADGGGKPPPSRLDTPNTGDKIWITAVYGDSVLNPRHQLLHQPPQFAWCGVPCHDFVIADPGFAQGFLLDCVARGGGALVVAGALVFERVAGLALKLQCQFT